MAGRIDRTSPLPLYHQLEAILREDIESGEYEPGDPLPSEGELCNRYEVSRSVVRQTLANLARSGLVRSERGRGTFVAESKLQERFVQHTRGFYEDLRDMGLPVSTAVLRQSLAPTPPHVREFLGCDVCLRIDRLRSVDGRLLAYVTTYIDGGRAPGLSEMNLTDRSLYKILEEDFGLRVGSGHRTVEAVGATEEIASALEVTEGTPLLLLRSASYDERGEPLEYFEAWHRGDRTLFEIGIVPGEPEHRVRGRVRDPGSALTANTRASWSVTAPAGASRPPLDGSGQEVLEALLESRAVALLRATHYGDPAKLAAGLRDGGVPLVEFTLTGANALEAIEAAATVEGAIVGAGSVVDLPSAEAAVRAGARFLVAPTSALHLASADLQVPLILSGLTPTEVWSAYAATGCPVKVSPASLGGPEHIRALHDPMPSVPLMPSGGVGPGNVAEYLGAGAVAVNVGGQLCPPEALEAGDGERLREQAQALRAAMAGSSA